MGDCFDTGKWSHAGPTVSGFYEVRPCPSAWILGSQSSYEAPGPRITYVDVATGLFNAGKFGGDIEEPLWDWKGPIQVPTALPAHL